jgi:hypothetical protein
MKLIRYGCAFLALLYFVYALLPSHFIVAQHSRAEEVFPEWFDRTIDIVYVSLYGIISYGLCRRTPLYWRLIPFLLGILLLCVFIPAIWTLHQLSLPWFPLIFGLVATFIAFPAFIAWWRNQKDYFSARSASDR